MCLYFTCKMSIDIILQYQIMTKPDSQFYLWDQTIIFQQTKKTYVSHLKN
uniref:Uncharacterized protein n=1 Tax=Rhizophora mucronata TaxID=61149 RepID=A0A2P2QEU7_RHIMU